MADSERSPLLIWLALLGVLVALGLWGVLGGADRSPSEVSSEGTPVRGDTPVLGQEFSPPGSAGAGTEDNSTAGTPGSPTQPGEGAGPVEGTAQPQGEPEVARPPGDPVTLASEAEALLAEGRHDDARAQAMACLAVDPKMGRCREARIQSYTQKGDYVDNEHILKHCRSAFRNDLNCLRALHRWHVAHDEKEPAAAIAREIELGFPGAGTTIPDPRSSGE